MTKLAHGAVWILIFTIPWGDMYLIPGFGTISRAIGLPVFAVSILASIWKRDFRVHILMHGLIFLFVIWNGLSYYWSGDPDKSIERINTYIQMAMLVWIIYQWSSDGCDVKRFLIAYVLGAYVTVSATVFDYLEGVQLVYQRYSVTGINPNDLAYIVSLAIPMAWYLSLRETKPLLFVLYRAFPVAATFTVFLTGSRSFSTSTG